MRLKSYKESNYGRPRIRDFRDKELKSKSQIKDLKRRKRLSGLYNNNNNNLKTAYI